MDPEQLKQDEILARELQNELFLSEDRTRTHQNHNDVMDTDEVGMHYNFLLLVSFKLIDLSLLDDSLREVKEKFNQIGEGIFLSLSLNLFLFCCLVIICFFLLILPLSFFFFLFSVLSSILFLLSAWPFLALFML